MRNILILALSIMPYLVLAQPGISAIVEKDGKRFYEHKVKSGNTLWGIQQMYGVSASKIIESNPSVAEGLQVDQIIYIPTEDAGVSEPQQVTTTYKVKNKETLYGLSKKFNTTVDELIALNPELSEGLKKGQLIKVPGVHSIEMDKDEVVKETPNPFITDTITTVNGNEQMKITFSDSTIKHVVLAHETMYSISKRFMVSIDEIMKRNGLSSTRVKEGQILIIPVKNESIEKVRVKPVQSDYNPDGGESLAFEAKDEYRVAIMLPLHLDYGPSYSEYVSNISTQFYMGATMALDSLKKKGFRATVEIYDTKNDSATIAGILADDAFLYNDLLIGPLLSKNMYQVARYCKANKIRMVSPVSTSTDLLENNRLVYNSVPSDITLMRGMARYLLENHSTDNIVLIKPLDKESLPLYEAFRKAFNEIEITGARPNLVETTIEGFNTYIKRGAKNRLVLPTENRSTAAKFMNNVNRSSFRAKPDQIYVYGTKNWVNFTDIHSGFKNKYNLHFPSPNHADYYTDELTKMNASFRDIYQTDMSKMALQAYDVCMYYCSSFFLGNNEPYQLMNQIEMHQISANDGFENKSVFIIEHEEYELIHVGTSSGE